MADPGAYVPLLFRRVRPLTVFALVSAGSVSAGSAVMSVAVPEFVPLFCVWLALYTVALLCRRPTAAGAAALACVD